MVNVQKIDELLVIAETCHTIVTFLPCSILQHCIWAENSFDTCVINLKIQYLLFDRKLGIWVLVNRFINFISSGISAKSINLQETKLPQPFMGYFIIYL